MRSRGAGSMAYSPPGRICAIVVAEMLRPPPHDAPLTPPPLNQRATRPAPPRRAIQAPFLYAFIAFAVGLPLGAMAFLAADEARSGSTARDAGAAASIERAPSPSVARVDRAIAAGGALGIALGAVGAFVGARSASRSRTRSRSRQRLAAKGPGTRPE